jgi:uncharacterized protein (TIGR04562 family)
VINRPEFLDQHIFNWETLHVICSGQSSLDAKNYLTELYGQEEVYDFLVGYGFDLKNPIESAELFGIYQEALQFIKRYFLREGNPEGIELSVPNFLYSLTDITSLFLLATDKKAIKRSPEESLWAGVVLKVMHTILHADKDLRYRYFNVIQQQIFDRFYKHIVRDEDNNLFLRNDKGFSIPLVDFQTKAKKGRESIIIKLLHKKENVAEELFDRIGVRFVTKTKLDSLRVLKFLVENYIVIINNIKPSRSQNNLVDLELLKRRMHGLLKQTLRQNLSEEQFFEGWQKLVEECAPSVAGSERNQHSSDDYRAIHFTGRQLIKYRNPFMSHFNEVRKAASQDKDNELSKLVLALDTTPIARDVRFFYPFEVQITDEASHSSNTQGQASHEEYKKSQVKSAMKRIFKPLIELKNITFDENQ